MAELPEPATIGVIGLGNIGGGVARNLARAGLRPNVFDLDSSRLESVTAEGCVAAVSVAEVAAASRVVFTSLPGPRQIASVGAEMLPAMSAGSVWVELSTNDLETARAMVVDAAEHGVRVVDAPVSGGPEGAEAGSLAIFVGGEDDAVADVLGLLEIIGAKVDHLGLNGAGIVAKIAQVTLCYTQTITLIEALLLGVKGGVDPAKMLDLIQNSAGTSYCATTYGPEILAGTYDESFPLSHAAKDLRLAMSLARAVDAELPLTSDVADIYADAEQIFGSTAAHCLAAQLIERRNDLILHQQGASE